jgi:hypothetical protein
MPDIRACELPGWFSNPRLLRERIGRGPERRVQELIQSLRLVYVQVRP